ncbi:hypothetical protein ESY86_00235 [Subsaximicrobium wynnwilliamsii]|uniref:Aerotolerance regulator N-terminal domain-containing protein n=1 Tax=Subsaximicrobium wynnwilliamsii TaxID=291179 RepID=A0A5C6ZQ63_9FLAO|nr:BatA domain-containing protein [Subsaximicrobium wynnwilliamsii]TXD85020.1 hypothetical protein ESY87_01405 [Subsaximicrobium wynnwilliamsii]TXD91063.1 hypothetical protein ESY86_00235 [Subsaximicrobium wynnwilliamsii]TXE04457.1 hypothetical protein ESY88_02885 [Subsaximicrobium wynnwilliamsii]
MQFKYPELLYALLLLVIPIIIHLFQLRKFQKVGFTNVQFLKQLTIQTRKSSQLKKWLILLMRLLLLACIIIAFAQPYSAKTNDYKTKSETVIYLDNSFSMQAKGANGSLLNSAIQDLLERLDAEEPISIFTNNANFSNTTIKAIKNELINLGYAPKQLSYEATVLKGKQLFTDDASAIKNLLLISDFQQQQEGFSTAIDSSVQVKMVQLQPENINNISVDSVFISEAKVENIELSVTLKNYGAATENVSVSLFNQDKLVAKNAVDIEDQANVTFTIAQNKRFDGSISIEDPNLQYDNTLYFNLDETEKIKVLSINSAEDVFLRKIYTTDEFEYSSSAFGSLDYNAISNQNLVVLNELDEIPVSLATALKVFSDDGGSILIIPSSDIVLNTYNQLFTNFNLAAFSSKSSQEKRVTAINFSHPLFENVFEKRISNFQYPKVQDHYGTASSSSQNILSFEDGQAFLSAAQKVYRFSASLSESNSNFKNSPLIVPILYNIGKQSLNTGRLYANISEENKIDINASLQPDAILTLAKGEETVIPLQRRFSNKVEITASNYPEQAGIVAVMHKEKFLKNLSFNYDRAESVLRYMDLTSLKNANVQDSVASAIDEIKSATNVNELWKWFVIFALFFLIIELLILKFFK